MVKSRIISLSSNTVGRPEANFVEIDASPPSRYFEIQSKTDDRPTSRISAIRSAVSPLSYIWIAANRSSLVARRTLLGRASSIPQYSSKVQKPMNLLVMLHPWRTYKALEVFGVCVAVIIGPRIVKSELETSMGLTTWGYEIARCGDTNNLVRPYIVAAYVLKKQFVRAK